MKVEPLVVLVFVLVLVPLGCGDNQQGSMQLRSGSRLKLAWYEYEGGARELETDWYFDRVLGERCLPMTWSDGREYCSPAMDEAVYDSDTCTSAVGRTLAGRTPSPFYATTFKLTALSEVVLSRMFRRANARAAPDEVWHRVGALCIRGDVGGFYDYFDLGDEVSVSELVGIQRGAPSGGELAVIYELGDDHLQVPFGLYDRAADTKCTAATLPNALDVPCVPATTRMGEVYYLDPACTDVVVAVLSGERPPLIALHDARTSCETYHRVGDSRTLPGGQQIFQLRGAECIQVTRTFEPRFYDLAERAYVPVLGRMREPGASRVRAIARVGEQLELRDPLMYDAELDIECLHDDELRCVPPMATRHDAVTPTTFLDPQCQIHLGVAVVPRGACDPPQRFASDGVEYYELMEPYTNPIYVLSSEDECTSYTPPEPLVAYRISASVAQSTFAQATLVIEP